MAQQTEIEIPAQRSQEAPRQAAPPPPPEKRSFFEARPQAKKYLLIFGVVLFRSAVFGWIYLSGYESTDDAQIDGHLMPLSARIPGYVTKVNVNDNQVVTAGTVLVEIDPKDYQIALDKAKADLADAQATAQSLNINVPITSVNAASQVSSSEADVQNATAGIAWAQQQLDAAKSQLTQAQAANVTAQNDLVRYKQLVDKQEVSQQRYDQAVASAKAGAAAVDAANAAVSAADQQVLQYRSKLLAAQAALRASQTGPQQVASQRARALSAQAAVQLQQANVDQAELNLSYAQLVAPVTGIVTKSVEVGMNVQPGQQLLTIVPLDD